MFSWFRRKKNGSGKAAPAERPVSTDRRQFFREMMVQAIEGAEELGKQMQQGRRLPSPYGYGFGFEDEAHAPPDFSHLDHGQDAVQGPPWPPAAGPTIPLALRQELREPRLGSVSRSSGAIDDLDEEPATGAGAEDDVEAGAAPARTGG